MKKNISRIIGFLLILLASSSLLISGFFLIQIWKAREPLMENLTTGLDLFSDTLSTTEDGLDVIEGALENTATIVNSLEEAILSIAQSVHDSSLVVDSVAELIGEDIQTTIDNTQVSIDSAQASAQVIDNILSTLSRIPLINLEYQPEVPLHEALNDISITLEDLPDSLSTVEDKLKTTSDNLTDFETQVLDLLENIELVRGNISEAQDVVNEYQLELKQLQNWLVTIQDSMPRWITLSAWVISFIIFWIAITQIGMLVQGLERLSRTDGNKQQESE
jgi:peptidoglycan hydrolase CwlO-like protein